MDFIDRKKGKDEKKKKNIQIFCKTKRYSLILLHGN